MAWAVVQKESTSRPYAHNDNPVTGDNSYGLFQINMFRGLEASRLEKYNLDKNEDLFDPYTNAKIAFKISDGGRNWGAWTTYTKAKSILSQFPD
jgi:soluble lytic murein transglycosylase-like protein